MTYTLLDSHFIRRDADGAIIAADPDNHDYAAYLAWIAAGNAPTLPPAPTPNALTLGVNLFIDASAEI
jgi:hypothetical protein